MAPAGIPRSSHPAGARSGYRVCHLAAPRPHPAPQHRFWDQNEQVPDPSRTARTRLPGVDGESHAAWRRLHVRIPPGCSDACLSINGWELIEPVAEVGSLNFVGAELERFVVGDPRQADVAHASSELGPNRGYSVIARKSFV